MRVVIARSMPGESFSMDVYANGLVAGLRTVRPEWEFIEVAPYPLDRRDNSWIAGLRRYYERFWCYPRVVMNQKADIFHIVDHSYGHLVYWLKQTKAPVVITCHDLINFYHPENLYARSRLPLVSMIAWKFSVQGMRSADWIVTVSSHTARDVTRLLRVESERIAVVPDGIDLRFRPLPRKQIESFRQRYSVSLDTVRILHVGRTDPRKNILAVLEVVKILKMQGVSVCLWKVGENFTAEQRAIIQAYNLESNVTYLGKLDLDALVQAYNAADVLLFPSFYEGFGLPVLEAMACGIPVITSNVSSLPEVAGDAAILVEPTDVPAMVEAILRLKNDPAYRRKLINKGYARASSFTWEAVAKQIALIYEKVVNKGVGYARSDSS
jgi:glycosyltransferase involved in cell wall biosynthesis